jgi:amino acid adenylation domain-containing protein
VLRPQAVSSSSDFRRFLLERLPDYMVPAHFLTLERFPLTANGKLDRRALPLPEQSGPAETVAAPQTPAEEILAGIWARVLNKEQISIHDNFFELGGDSIRSVQVLAQARERDLHFSLQQLFQYPTIHELAQVARSEGQLADDLLPVQPFSLISEADRQLLPASIEDAYPLALLQVGMLFHSQYNPDEAIYHDITSYHLQVDFRAELFREALQRLTERHAILRTSFDVTTCSEPLQLVHQQAEIPLAIDDLSMYSPAEQKQRFAAWVEEEKRCPFDWRQPPLVRVHIHLCGERLFTFSLCCHHAVLDGWSVATLFTELFKDYLKLLEGKRPELEPELAVQFRDYIALERKRLKSQETQRFWNDKLVNYTSMRITPWPDGHRSSAYEQARSIRLPISAELSAKLKRLALQAAVPVKSVLLAAHLRVLQALGGQDDITTGLVFNGRPETTGSEHMLGLFLNTLPLRVRMAAGTWVDLVRATFAAEREILPHRWYPLAEIQRQQGGQALFDTIFNFTHFHVYQEVAQAEGLQILGRGGFEQTNFTLSTNFFLDPITAQIHLYLAFHAPDLSNEQIEAIGTYYSNTLQLMAEHPDAHYEYSEVLAPRERELVVSEWNDTSTSAQRTGCIHQLFEAQVERMPEATAVTYNDQRLSYTVLNQRANKLAHQLRARNIGPGMLVGLCVERSPEMLVGMLGILKAGAAYVPLDPAYPSERLAFMIEDSQIAVLVTQDEIVPRLSTNGLACLSLSRPRGAGWMTHNPDVTMDEQHLAYVIYTSGSTGKPKGTAITHRNVVNFFESMRREPGMTARDRVLAVTSLSFDIAVLELLLPLTLGASVTILSRAAAADGSALVAALKQSQATIMQATPATWRILLDTEEYHSALREGQIKPLTILCGGEALPRELAAQLLQYGPRLWNMYGPTETTIWSATGAITDPERISIGRPIDNTQIYLLDAHLMPVPFGTVGELFIGGEGLARGYLGRPDLTAERFVPDPFSSQPGKRLYRTGDLARWLGDGKLECLGRIDHQIKLRGYRIELGEIEALLEKHPAIRESVVVVREDRPDDKRLVAYVVARNEVIPTAAELRQYLQSKVPEYMLPAQFMALPALPLTPNGKVDRRALPAPGEDMITTGDELFSPRTPMEEILLRCWQEIFKRQKIGVHDNFFALGGHSLLATQLVSRLRVLLQIDLPLRSIFEAPTIGQLATGIARLQQNGGRPVPSIIPASREQVLPLSFAQQRLWFLDQMEPGSAAYNLPIVLHLGGSLRVDSLEDTIRQLVQRHESLRTTFQIQEETLSAVQVIAPESTLQVKHVDLRALAQPERESAARRLIQEEALAPFNLACGPLLRVSLLHLAEQEHVLLLTLHHTISDGWSNGILLQELIALYNAQVEGRPVVLPDLPIQYADFALWQRSWLQGEVLEAQLEYWKQQLSGSKPLDLPTDHPRAATAIARAVHQNFSCPPILSERLNALCQREGVTLFMALLAVFQVLLARYSGQDDICVGSAVANRTQPETEGVIGFFANTLVFRTGLAGNPTFRELLKRVREVTLAAYTHQDLPFEKLVEELQPERSLNQNPFFQVGLILQNQAIAQSLPSMAGLEIQAPSAREGVTLFDLQIFFAETPEGLQGTLVYNATLFEAPTMERMLAHFQKLLEEVTREPGQRIHDIELLSGEELHRVLVEWNETQLAPPVPRCFHECFAEQVAEAPDAIAVVFEHEWLTYGELDRRSNQLAHYLQSLGVGPECLVGLCMERSSEVLIALLAILKAGGAFVPLDPAYPLERLHYMLEMTRARVIITQQHLKEHLRFFDTHVLCLQDSWPAISTRSAEAPQSAVVPDNAAYVIFTSGSTGRPKGVLVSHRGIANLSLGQTEQFGAVRREGHVLQFASLSFDASVFEIMLALLLGSTLHMARQETLLPGPDLLHLLEEQAITTIVMPPSVLAALAEEGLPHLQTIIAAGEACSPELVKRWAPGRRFFNGYGPTETTIAATAAECHPAEKLTIGRPLVNTHVYLLDQYLQPVPQGLPGELYVDNPWGLARGYLHRPDLTAERFIPHPFSTRPGARLYKTGDLGRYLPDGQIEFLGRVDLQVKIHGFRIELGEIESVLDQHPAVQECVVLAYKDASGGDALAAYVVLREQVTSSKQELRTYLREHLPHYMLPTAILGLDAFPLSPNGKLDRGALPSPLDEEDEPRENEPLRTPVEEVLAGLWREMLGRTYVGPESNFFTSGGHSLLATQLMARIRAFFRVNLSLRTLFDAPTLDAFAQKVEEALRSRQFSQLPPLVPISRSQPLPLSFMQQRLWFLDQLQPGTSAYTMPLILRVCGPLQYEIVERSLSEIVRRHESLRTTFASIDGEPVQVIHPALPCPVKRQRIAAGKHREREAFIQQWVREQTQQPFDLARGPLLRAALLQVSEDEHILCITMHHIISDAWSIGVLMREFTTLYMAFLQQQPSPLPELPIQYADVAAWQRQWLQGEVLDHHLNYWRQQLQGATALNLPLDHPRPEGGSTRGAVYSFTVPAELAQALRDLSQREGSTLFMTLLAAFQVLLYRVSGQEDVVVGTDVANRASVEIELLIGFFINLLALRSNLGGQPSFKTLLSRVREMVLGAYVHQDIPFDVLVDHLRLKRTMGQTPLIQVLFVLQNLPSAKLSDGASGLTIHLYEDEAKTAKFDLALFMSEGTDGIAGAVNYCSDLFEAATIEHLMSQFLVLLRSIVEEPDTPVSALDMATEAEKEKRAQEKQAHRGTIQRKLKQAKGTRINLT